MAKVPCRRWPVGIDVRAIFIGCLLTFSFPAHGAEKIAAKNTTVRPTSPAIKREASGLRIPLTPPRERTAKVASRWSLVGNQNSMILRGLLVVGGLTAWCIWYRSALRRSTSQGNPGVIQVYGKVALDQKQQLHFVRIGQRLIVLVQGPQGVQHVTEFEDPEEVQRILTHWQSDRRGAFAGDLTAELAAHASQYAVQWDDSSLSHDARRGDLRTSRGSRDLPLSQLRNS